MQNVLPIRLAPIMLAVAGFVTAQLVITTRMPQPPKVKADMATRVPPIPENNDQLAREEDRKFEAEMVKKVDYGKEHTPPALNEMDGLKPTDPAGWHVVASDSPGIVLEKHGKNATERLSFANRKVLSSYALVYAGAAKPGFVINFQRRGELVPMVMDAVYPSGELAPLDDSEDGQRTKRAVQVYDRMREVMKRLPITPLPLGYGNGRLHAKKLGM